MHALHSSYAAKYRLPQLDADFVFIFRWMRGSRQGDLSALMPSLCCNLLRNGLDCVGGKKMLHESIIQLDWLLLFSAWYAINDAELLLPC